VALLLLLLLKALDVWANRLSIRTEDFFAVAFAFRSGYCGKLFDGGQAKYLPASRVLW
jgi:hypothetical protein